MRKPIIAVDMDDTICHLVKRAIYHNNNDFPTHLLRYEDMLDWDTDHLRHRIALRKSSTGGPVCLRSLNCSTSMLSGKWRSCITLMM